MLARYRLLILAVVVVAVVATPLLTITWRNGFKTATDSFETRTQVDFANRQTRLRRIVASAAYSKSWRKPAPAPGVPFARLVVPKLGVDLIVVEGTSGDSLKNGAGHYESSVLPGDMGNVAIAGHRTDFGKPFRHLETLRPGDLLFLTTPDGRFTYRMTPAFDGHTNPWVTTPLDWTVVGPVEAAVVTLTTADPPHTSKNRLIARFALAKKEPA